MSPRSLGCYYSKTLGLWRGTSPDLILNKNLQDPNCTKCNMGHALTLKPQLNEIYLLPELTTAGFWIGASDEGQEGTWIWRDGTSVKIGTPFWGINCYTNPPRQQPDGDSVSNCAVLTPSGFYFFHDYPCSNNYSPLCEYAGAAQVKSQPQPQLLWYHLSRVSSACSASSETTLNCLDLTCQPACGHFGKTSAYALALVNKL